MCACIYIYNIKNVLNEIKYSVLKAKMIRINKALKTVFDGFRTTTVTR